jgi:hypothetical protein
MPVAVYRVMLKQRGKGSVMYDPYPVSDPPRQAVRVGPPRSVVRAVRLMYAGAAIELVALIVAIISRNSLKSAILKLHPHYTTLQLHHAEVLRTSALVIGAIIAVGLWLWMAAANSRGLSWARIVSAVFFGINTLALIISVTTARAVATLIVGIVIWLVGLATIVLLFNRESSPFYNRPVA